MFKTRLLSGIVLVIIMGLCFYFGGFLLATVIGIVSLIGMNEYYKAVKLLDEGKIINPLTAVGYLGSIALFVLIVLDKAEVRNMIFVPIVTCSIMLCVYVFTFPKYRIENIVSAFFGFCYVPLLMCFVYLTREMSDGIYLVWLVFFASWISDTFAYLTGMLLGKHKLAPILSPKKSIEGAVGGVFFAALLSGIYGYLIQGYLQSNFPVVITFVVVCAVGACFSQVGDLAASAIKRNFEIKDYGKLIPGHGGILDRFDSVIFAAPMVYLVAYIFMK